MKFILNKERPVIIKYLFKKNQNNKLRNGLKKEKINT